MIPYIDIKGIAKSYGDVELYNDLTFTINQGDKCALIAKNGAGKSTLLNIIASNETADKGDIVLRNDITVGFLEQEPSFKAGISVFDALYHESNEVVSAIKEYEKALLSGSADAISATSERMDVLGAWSYEERAKVIFTKLKMTNFNQSVDTLSGGERKRLALAMLLIEDPDVFILDEPTNHIDLDMAEWLEDFLIAANKTILMVTHDRYFLDRVCNYIYEIDQKQLYAYQGNYSDYVLARGERIEQFNNSISKAQNLYKKELDWMRRMPQARGTKAKYRKDAFYEVKDKAFKSRNDDSISINLQTKRIGTKIFEAHDISFSYDDKKILDKFNYTFARYQKLGIVGKNGAGKSTFLNILTGSIKPQSGLVDVGTTVSFGYYKQQDMPFDLSKRVIDVVTDIAEVVTIGDGKTITASQFLNMFLFTPETQYGIIAKLSGGEKRRLYLLTVLMRSPNFLILDEPTNDLDIMTLNILEDYLSSFGGCLIVVSHDRYFMDKVTDNIMVFEGDGKIRIFEGNYTQYRDKIEEEQKIASNTINAPEQPRAVRVNDRERKLSFKEKKELDELSISIASLEEEKKEIELLLSGGALSSPDIVEKSARYSVIGKELEEKEERWFELSLIE